MSSTNSSLTLICGALDDGNHLVNRDTFAINVSSDDLVDCLKNAIFDQLPPRFLPDVPVRLRLWKVSNPLLIGNWQYKCREGSIGTGGRGYSFPRS
jgi:hypothetical protein